MRQVYDQVYWISLRAEFMVKFQVESTGTVYRLSSLMFFCGSSLLVQFHFVFSSQVYVPSLWIMFTSRKG